MAAVKEPARGGKTNRLGLSLKNYQGAPSTLCAGCGHDAISSSIMKAFFDLDIHQHEVAKLSGIGCSSKTTNYFLDQSHGFNSVHGRMASIATGVAVANEALINIGVSGDGDTASIGFGNFAHMVRRNVPLVYVVENNGCYGLTKGQASATADRGSMMKSGEHVNSEPVDICALAIQMGCGFVARSFSGDTKQVRELVKGALSHRGTAVLDIISPCVTFNDHEGSTKSRQYARENEDPLHDIDYIPHHENITIDYEPGALRTVSMHDGSQIILKKLDFDYDPTDHTIALSLLEKARREQLFYTGLIYVSEDTPTLPRRLNLVDTPLVHLAESDLRPSAEAFAEIMESLK